MKTRRFGAKITGAITAFTILIYLPTAVLAAVTIACNAPQAPNQTSLKNETPQNSENKDALAGRMKKTASASHLASDQARNDTKIHEWAKISFSAGE